MFGNFVSSVPICMCSATDSLISGAKAPASEVSSGAPGSTALALVPVPDCQQLKGVPFAPGVKFSQIVITGPPGSGKSTFVKRIGGWPEEGYIDLTFNGWWKVHSLNLRPREIHLGLPFSGQQDALAMFEDEWLDAWDRLVLVPERILLPPKKRFFFSVDWHSRFVFEFLLPDPERIFAQRKARAELGTHPVDEHLDLEQVRRQCEVFLEAAAHFHRNGLLVYIRKDIDGNPRRIAGDPDDL